MENTKYTIDAANSFISENKKNLSKLFKPNYHFSSSFGMINNPFGLCIVNNKFHLFFESNPYSLSFDHSYINHVTSMDLITFNSNEIILAPDRDYDFAGCLAGDCFYEDNRIFLFYTGFSGDAKKPIQGQCYAVSDDSLSIFGKVGFNPVCRSEGFYLKADQSEFKNPSIILYNGGYLLLVGTSHHNSPLIVVYFSKNLKDWKVFKRIFGKKTMGNYFEHINALLLKDGRLLLIFNACGVDSKFFENNGGFATFYTIVSFKPHDIELSNNDIHVLDYGFDFCSPSIADKNEKIFMIGSVNSQNHANIYSTLNLGWGGCFSLPRELTIDENDEIRQKTYQTLTKYMKKSIVTDYSITKFDCDIDVVTDSSCLITVPLKMIASQQYLIKLFKTDEMYFEIFVDVNSNSLIIDRSKTYYKFISNDLKDPNSCNRKMIQLPKFTSNILRLDIYLDVSTIEIFINDGKMVLTNLAFNHLKSQKMTICSKIDTSLSLSYTKILNK